MKRSYIDPIAYKQKPLNQDVARFRVRPTDYTLLHTVESMLHFSAYLLQTIA